MRGATDSVVKKVGQLAAESCRLSIHDDRSNVVKVGRTFFDTPVLVNREVLALYVDLTGQHVPFARQRDGGRWIVEPADISSSLRYWRDGLLTPRAWLRSLAAVEEAAWMAADDPLPAAAIGMLLVARNARPLVGSGQ
jgi:hypothetical protein